MSRPAGGRARRGIVLALILGTTVAVYWQVVRHPYVSLDDGQYVTRNPHVRAGLTPQGFRWAFAATEASNWHPLTWLSHQADVEMFGIAPGPHHVVNLLHHLLNTGLLYSAFVAMTGCRRRSAFVAAVFALHPLHVEPVAWISERKDLLSTMFGLLALNAYVRHARTPSLRTYLPVPVLFAMALMSKPMLVTLPLLLLLLDWWPLGRISGEACPPARGMPRGLPARPPRSIVFEKVPLLALSAASCVVTYMVQDRSGAVASADRFPFADRAANAVVAYAGYVARTVWPAHLAVFYPHPGGDIAARDVALAAALVAAVTVAVIVFRKSRPALAAGWFWYLGTLVPVIGLVQVGLQAMADRYTYLPQTGLAIMVAYGMFPRANTRGAPRAVAAAAVLLVAATSVATWRQVRLWSSDAALFSHAARHTDRNFLAYDVLGKSAFAAGRPEEAIRLIRESLRFRPRYAMARYDLGVIYGSMGRVDEAIAEYREALRLRPDQPDAWTNLGAMLTLRGRIDDAVLCYLEALRGNPDDPFAHNNLGLILARAGRRSNAVFHFREALRIDPGYAAAAENLRNAVGDGPGAPGTVPGAVRPH